MTDLSSPCPRPRTTGLKRAFPESPPEPTPSLRQTLRLSCDRVIQYDAFWLAQLGDLRELIGDAAQGRAASADFSSIRPLGYRASWAGTASIHGAVVVKVAMAHLTSLARVVADARLCVPWPDQTFVFSMSKRGVLTVRPQSLPASSIASSAPISVASPIVKTVQPTEGEPLDPAAACRWIHDVVTGLPRYTDPVDVPVDNGLFFFFELGEDSPHGHPRITRIGNHPHAQDGLVARLRNHYATHRGAKNGSVLKADCRVQSSFRAVNTSSKLPADAA
jgi:hypothetical protein